MLKYYFTIVILFVSLYGFGQAPPDFSVAESKARSFLHENHSKFSLTEAEVLQLAVTHHGYSKKSGVTHIYFAQTFKDIEIFNAVINVHVDRNGQVVHWGDRSVHIKRQTDVARQATITREEAIGYAAQDLGLAARGTLREIEDSHLASIPQYKNAVFYENKLVSTDPIAVQPMYVYTEAAELKLVWDFDIATIDGAEKWNYHIDATNGAILNKITMVVECDFGHRHEVDAYEQIDREHECHSSNRMASYEEVIDGSSYRVYAVPVEAPSFGARTLVENPADDIASPYGWHDTNGVAGAEYTITRGNNVYAYTDTDANNVPDAGSSPDGGASLDFDFPVDLTLAPSTYRPAAVTNLFYMTNIMHDWAYTYGFDEANRNFQENNYGRGGIGNDFVLAEAQDGQFVNNAHFFYANEGNSPRIQMYLWNTSTPHRDGDFENGIIAHEYGHGISNRLTGNGSTCLFNNEQMGEGWSDYFGYMLTWQGGSDLTTARGIGTYALNQPTNGPGIRPARYAYDFAINNYTYANLSTLAVPHGVGFLWASMLWDMTVLLIDEHGEAAGLDISASLVMEGLKLQPCSPGFVDGRNAILAADALLFGGANSCIIWEAFARRGLGVGASQGSTDSNSDGVANFDLPTDITASLDIIDVVCITEGVFEGLDGGFPIGGVYSGPGVTDDGNGSTFTFDPNTAGAGNHLITYLIAETGCFPELMATANIEVYPGPELICTEDIISNCADIVTYDMPVLGGGCYALFEDFDEVSNPALPNGWSSITLTGTPNLWVTTTDQNVSSPNAVFAANLGTVSLSALISPEFAINSAGTISFSTRFILDDDYDGAVLEYSKDGGGTWQDITTAGTFIEGHYNGSIRNAESNPIGGRPGWVFSSWNFINVRISLDNSLNGENVQFRWLIGSGSSVAATGIWIDDVRVRGVEPDFTVTQIAGLPSGSIFPEGVTTNTFEVELPEGNTLTCSFDVTVTSSVFATIDAAPNPVSVGGTLNLSSGGGITYSWSGPAGFTSIEQNPTIDNIQLVNAGLYTVTVTSNSGCTGTAAVNIFVNEIPTIDPIPNFVYCNGDTTAEINFGGNADYYTWTGTNGTIGLPTAGTGNIPSFTAINTGTAPITDTITVYPHFDGFAYLPNFSLHNMSVISLRNDNLVATFPVGINPNSVAFTSDGSKAYIANRGSSNIIEINTATNNVTNTIALSSDPYSMIITPDGSYLYITSYFDNKVMVVDLQTLTTTVEITGLNGPWECEIGLDGSKVYVANRNSGSVSVISTATNTIINTIPVTSGFGEYGVRVSPDGSKILVSNINNTSVSIIDVNSETVIDQFNITESSTGICFSPNGEKAYFVNYSGGKITEVDLLSNTVTVILSGLTLPNSMQFAPDGSKAYIQTSTSLVIFDPETNAIVGTVSLGAHHFVIGRFIMPGYVGSPQTFTIIVHPTPVATASATPNPICSGNTLSLSATGGATYTWSGPNGFVSTEQNPEIANVQMNGSGLYTVTVTSAAGCSATSAVEVVVNQSPTATATATPNPICSGNTLSLSATGAGTYTWSGPNGFTSTDQNPTIANIQTTGSGIYTVTVTSVEGCTATATVNVTVNQTPTATASASPNPICSGNTLSLNASGGTTYAWSGPNGFTSTDQNPTIANIQTTGSGIYTVTVTTVEGCTATATVNVTVNQTPTATASATPNPICSGNTLSLSATGGATYAWSGPAGFTSSLQNPTRTNVQTNHSGIYTVTVTSTAGCTSTATVNVTVNQTPTATASATPNPICSGNTLSLSATGGATYAWSGPAGFTSSLQNPTRTNVQTNHSGIYTVTVTSSAGCTATATVNVTVNQTPTATASATPNPICSGESLFLTASGGATYAWSGPDGFNTTTQNPIRGNMQLSHAGIYTVTVTSIHGCTSTASVNVIVNSIPNGTISATPNPVCIGSSLQLGATGGVFYSWSGPGGYTSGSQNPLISNFQRENAGIYTVTITNAQGCSQVLSTQVGFLYPPIAEADYAVGSACVGGDLLLYGSGLGSYAWSGPNGFSSNEKDPVVPNVGTSSSGLYTLIVTSPNGCTASASIQVTISPLPVVTAFPASTLACEGESIQLNADGQGTFSWSGPWGWRSDLQNPLITSIPQYMSGAYTVSLTGPTGCSATATVEVKVFPRIEAQAWASHDTICEGGSLQLNASGGGSYLWTGPAGFNATQSNPRIDRITLKHTGWYTVYIRNEGGCEGYAQVYVHVRPLSVRAWALATPNPVIEGGLVKFNSPAGSGHSWTGPNGFTSQLQNFEIEKVNRRHGGIYTVTILGEEGCASSAYVVLQVKALKGDEQATKDDINIRTESLSTGTVYPNPTTNQLYLETEGEGAISYRIYTAGGEVVHLMQRTTERFITTEQLASGMYLIVWKAESETAWHQSRFVKIK